MAAAAALCVASPAFAAPPDVEGIACARNGQSPAGTRFHVKGQATFLGGWAVAGDRASLCFRGAAPDGATILAAWTTPWSHSGRYEFTGGYDFNSVNPSDNVVLSVADRVQVRGEKWSPWFVFHQRSRPPVGGGGAGFGTMVAFASSSGATPTTPRVRWEWRLVVTLSAPTAIDLHASLRSK